MHSLKSVLSNVKKGHIDNVYFLKGEDQFLQNFFINKLYEKLFFNSSGSKIFLTASEFPGKEIIDTIQSIDLFYTKKLFILKNPQKIKGKPLGELLDYCHNPINNHFLVLINDDFVSNDSFLKKIPINIPRINTSTPFHSELIKWARYFIKENKKTIASELLMQIVEGCGDSLYNLRNEINKICLSVIEEEIKKDNINFGSSFLRARKRWELMTAIGRRDLKMSIKLGRSILKSSDTLLSLIFQLLVFFQEILFIKMNNGTFIKPSGYIPLSSSLQNNLVAYSSNFQKNEVIKAIRKLKEIEIKQKTSYIDDETEFISFIYNAFE